MVQARGMSYPLVPALYLAVAVVSAAPPRVSWTLQDAVTPAVAPEFLGSLPGPFRCGNGSLLNGSLCLLRGGNPRASSDGVAKPPRPVRVSAVRVTDGEPQWSAEVAAGAPGDGLQLLGYGTFRLNFHHFDRLELDLRGRIHGPHVWGAAFSCLRLKWADMVLI